MNRNEAYVSESKSRDKYGRPLVTVTIFHPTHKGVRATGVVVTMPKAVREKRPAEAYLANDWSKGPHEGVTYHAKRAAALAHLKEELFRELEKTPDPTFNEKEAMETAGQIARLAGPLANGKMTGQEARAQIALLKYNVELLEALTEVKV